MHDADLLCRIGEGSVGRRQVQVLRETEVTACYYTYVHVVLCPYRQRLYHKHALLPFRFGASFPYFPPQRNPGACFRAFPAYAYAAFARTRGRRLIRSPASCTHPTHSHPSLTRSLACSLVRCVPACLHVRSLAGSLSCWRPPRSSRPCPGHPRPRPCRPSPPAFGTARRSS